MIKLDQLDQALNKLRRTDKQKSNEMNYYCTRTVRKRMLEE